MINLQDPSCIDCGSGGEIHQHHVVPRSLGGTFMVPLCSSCHALVHSREELSIKALTKKAMQAKRRRGEYTGGVVPYGFILSDDGVRLVEYEREQLVIASVRELRIGGMTLRGIADELANRGVFNRSGKAFSHVAISRMMDVSGGKIVVTKKKPALRSKAKQKPKKAPSKAKKTAQQPKNKMDNGVNSAVSTASVKRYMARVNAFGRPTLTAGDVAEIMEVHPNTVKRWIGNGNLKTASIGRKKMISKPDLKGFLRDIGGQP